MSKLQGLADGRASKDQEESQGAPAVPCRIILPVVPAARVIGKQGASIRTIRDQSGATVRILQKELPQEMQRREDRVVVITGEAPCMREAISGVLERVFDRSGLPDRARGSKERAHIVEVLVPEKSGSHLIGQKGERIKSLIEETCCDIHVVKEPIAGLADQKRVRITGSTVAEVASAVWTLQEVLAELATAGVLKPNHFELREALSLGASGPAPPMSRLTGSSTREVPVRVLVAKDEAAWIVGKRGNKIMRLRDLAKVQMNDADAPPFDESDRVLEITGAPLEQRMRVVQMVVDDLALRQEACAELRLLLPTEQFGSVMGHRGETIRGIMQTTGAHLQQHKAERTQEGTEYKLRLVEIKGDECQRIEAVRRIHLALEVKNRDSAADMTAPAPSGFVDLGFGLDLGGLAPAAAPSPVARAPPPSLGAGAAALREAAAAGGATESNGHLTLQLAMPSEEVARILASESSGIAWRAGVQLAAGRGSGGIPILEVVGTAVGNSVACYLVQDRLFMMH